jgi:ribosomal protein L6P/L9E
MLFLVVKGSDAQEIGNFIKKLKNLKKYDIYKGKGFSDKKLKIKLKLFKKK